MGLERAPALYTGIDVAPEEFRKLLEETGLSQGQVARMSGLSTAAISRWANGERRIPESAGRFLLMVRLFKLLGISWDSPEELRAIIQRYERH